MNRAVSDIRVALRTLAHAPAFTSIAVLTLGLAIGVDTAVFSVFDPLVLRTLPYEDAEALVQVGTTRTGDPPAERTRMRGRQIADLRSEPGLFEALAGWRPLAPLLGGALGSEVVVAAAVTEGMFSQVLRVSPLLGRSFLPEEDRPGGAHAVVLGHAFWTERFGGDPSAIGGSLGLDGVPHTVIGVMPRGFVPPFRPDAVLWVAARLEVDPCLRCDDLHVIGRLAGGVGLPAARDRVSVVASGWGASIPDHPADTRTWVVGLRERLAGPSGATLTALLACVGGMLLLVCVNLGQLVLARAAARRKEFRLRNAVGATDRALARQLTVENLVLAGLAGVVGLGIAAWGRGLLLAIVPSDLPGLDSGPMDGRVLVFALGVTLLAGALVGAGAASGSARDRRGRPDSEGRRRGGRVFVHLLATAQIAVATALLGGTGLLTERLRTLEEADLGFEPEAVLEARVALPAPRFTTPAHRATYFRGLLDRLRELPGVEAIALIDEPPLPAAGEASFAWEEAGTSLGPDPSETLVRSVSPDYFYVVGQRMLDGRDVAATDDPGGARVAIVNATFARIRLGYPRLSAIGVRVTLESSGLPVRVVGVTSDVRELGPEGSTPPTIYLPFEQRPTAAASVVLRASESPGEMTDRVRHAIADFDPTLAPTSIGPMAGRVSRGLRVERVTARVLAALAGLTIGVAGLGLLGLLQQRVARRRPELGVRLALGADHEEIGRAVVGRGLALAAVGLAVGVVPVVLLWRARPLGGAGLTDALPGLLWMAALLLGAALVATWLPARTAAATDPSRALRRE